MVIDIGERDISHTSSSSPNVIIHDSSIYGSNTTGYNTAQETNKQTDRQTHKQTNKRSGK
jgi:hypothetical protein